MSIGLFSGPDLCKSSAPSARGTLSETSIGIRIRRLVEVVETFVDELGGASHLDGVAIAPADVEFSSATGDGNRLTRLCIAMQDRRNRRGTCSGAASPGLARAPLPDPHLDAL